MKPISVLLALFIAFVLTGCAGSTSFLGDNPDIQLAPGASQEVVLEFEAEGSHSGEYSFTATVRNGDGLTATVSPDKAEVDGVIEVTVTITAAADAEPTDFASVYVEGDDGSNGAGTTILVTILDGAP